MQSTPGIYLIVEFDWPDVVERELARQAHALHTAVQQQSWIREIVAASGGVGAGPSSIWVFWLANYAALDRLLRDQADPIGQAYRAVFSQMPRVQEKIREEVVFM